MSLLTELKRRNVFKVALLYIVAGWLILQVADVLFDQLAVPDWAFRFVFGMLLICFPLVLLFSWVFEITSDGIKREADVHDSDSITHDTGRRINKVIVALLVLAIVTVAIDRLIPEEQPAAGTNGAAGVTAAAPAALDGPDAESAVIEKSIAVLPFVNISGDPENEYFSDGLTEELLNALASIGELKVAGRTSSFAFKGQNTDLREIARRLDVANLLEGSVRKSGTRVRITAQLIKASDGFHLWSDTFDRELDDIFEIQEEIAEMVADAMQTALLGVEDAPLVIPTTSKPEAYEAYLRGRFLFRQAPDDEENRKRAEAEYLHALNIDPGFTLAHWGLFNILNFRHRNGVVDFQQGAADLVKLADRMITENPRLVESQLARGRAALVNLRFAETLTAYEDALNVNPGDVDAIMALGSIYGITGQADRAIEFMENALVRDPLALPVLVNTAWTYTTLNLCDEVRGIRERALAISADASRVNGLLAYCQISNAGDMDEVLELLEQEPVGFIRLTGLAIAHQHLGQSGQAQAAVAEMQEAYGDGASYQYGQLYAHWGQPDLAVEWLEKAYETGDPGVINLIQDPMLRPLRLDPGYLRLVAKWKNRGGL